MIRSSSRPLTQQYSTVQYIQGITQQPCICAPHMFTNSSHVHICASFTGTRNIHSRWFLNYSGKGEKMNIGEFWALTSPLLIFLVFRTNRTGKLCFVPCKRRQTGILVHYTVAVHNFLNTLQGPMNWPTR